MDMSGHKGSKLSSYLTLIITWSAICQTSCSEEVEEILHSTFQSYDKNVRPLISRGPVHVGVTAHILSISKVDTSNQAFSIDLYFRQTWSDPRLIFQPKPGISNVTLETDYLRRVWTPDTFFVNEASSSFQATTVNNELIRLRANGEVTKSMRLAVTATCPMSLNDFPFDHPVCLLHIESFSGTVQEILYEWIGKPSSITVDSSAVRGDFTIVGYRLDAAEIEALPPVVGKYSRLTLDIQLKRILGRYRTEFFSPYFLIGLLSVLGLWVGCPRFSIGLASAGIITLTVITGMQVLMLKLPKWADHTWIDVYRHMCLSFVIITIFASLLEINVPDYEEPAEEEEDLHLQVDNRKDGRSCSVASEDAKLVRPRLSECEGATEQDQLMEMLRKKVLKCIRRTHRFYFVIQPYVKLLILLGLILSNWIYWKMTPGLRPIHNLIRI